MPDLAGSGSGGTPNLGAFEANAGSMVTSAVQLAMAGGTTCPVPGTLCTEPTPGQTDNYEIRSALTISACNATSANVESGPHIGRNFVARWDVPNASPGTMYWACVAQDNATAALTGTYVNFVVY
ncbi:MAG TPA: hypothetical protein VNA57_10965 [Acidimicrobiales bacterium]|nr:hypothetical protein [Acidimicrobiales bacterium]